MNRSKVLASTRPDAVERAQKFFAVWAFAIAA
jgi:hypothetical protein